MGLSEICRCVFVSDARVCGDGGAVCRVCCTAWQAYVLLDSAPHSFFKLTNSNSLAFVVL
jgi:hypothetical protein